MRRVIFATLIIFLFATDVLSATFMRKQLNRSRVSKAYKTHIKTIAQEFKDAGAAWPTRGIYMRVFKMEGELELWAAPQARGGRWVKVKTIPICASSGSLGPKAEEGDFQVPEGFYTINRFNPWSSFHLSLGIDYPNAVDKVRADTRNPGSDIFIHGGCATVGCVPLTDTIIEKVYVAAALARSKGQYRVPVHLFPCRMGDGKCQTELDRLGRSNPKLKAFWKTLKPGHDRFDTTGVPPRVKAQKNGTYKLFQ
jgi:murein L,D-transpeptidase YafK